MTENGRSRFSSKIKTSPPPCRPGKCSWGWQLCGPSAVDRPSPKRKCRSRVRGSWSRFGRRSCLSLGKCDNKRLLMATVRIQPEAEADLIARVCGGEHEAFYELVRPHERGIYMAALSILNNDADAEEVVQEAILKAFKAIGKFRGEAKFSTWIIQITINEARMKLRKDRRHLYESIDESRRGEDEGDYIPNDFADWREIPSEALESSRLRQALKQGLASLDPKYREVLVL